MKENREVILDKVRTYIGEDKQLSCVKAHQIAEKLGIEPEELGELINGLDVRITMCQLGFFGYAARKGMPGYKLVKKLDSLPEPATALVREAVVEGKISCRALWKIAAEQRLKRLDIGNIAETLEIKVTPCQLGCF